MKEEKIRIEIEKKAETVIQIRNEFDKETDRGCCLMAVSFLEHELERLLKDKLVGTSKFVKTLFEFNGPLGTFSAKIKMAFAIGFISKKTLNDLEIIRKIRNDFGHKHQPIDFETQELRDRVLNLEGHYYGSEKTRARAIFTNTVTGILAELHVSTLPDGFK